MGVYIKDMEMPTNCMLCPLCVEEADPANGEMCMVTGTLMPPCTRERLDNCPLVPVPPHGDLIDRDAARETIKPWSPEDERNGCTFDTVKKLMHTMLDRVPTIIPAEEVEA